MTTLIRRFRGGSVHGLSTSFTLILLTGSMLFPLHALGTPIGTTYSVHHMVGADIDGEGRIICRFIFDPSDPPPGAPDDVVTFDAVSEPIRTDVFGTVPTVTESKTDNGTETHLLVIDTSSPRGTDLFPSGAEDPDTGTPLTDACFFIGLDDPLDWPGVDTVTAASISYLTDGNVVDGPFDVSGPVFFRDPWNGFFAVTLADGAGRDINGIRLEIQVEKAVQGPVNACCAGGQCLGDIEEASCAIQGGDWIEDASCGANPDLPTPICDQVECSFNNGFPLDDDGAPPSQYAPDTPFSAASADDFILQSHGGNDDPCLMNRVLAWMTHSVAGVSPNVDYQGVNVTIYANATPKGPNGRPENDGSHSPDALGGVVYSQTIPMSAVTATLSSATCVGDVWKLDIPIEMVLNNNTKYWVEVQPIMDALVGRVLWVLSENNTDHPAQQIAPQLGINSWQEIEGNEDGCPTGVPPTPEAGTRRNLAFRLVGERRSTPANDDCADAIPVDDGIVPINNLDATTDGPDEPPVCTFFGDSNVGSDIWFNYIASCSGDLTVSLCGSDYDAKLAVYGECGRCPPQNPAVACDDDFCAVAGPSQVTLPVVAGDCYRIRVGGFTGRQGKGIMTITCVVPPPPTGACCDLRIGNCRDGVLEANCAGDQEEWTEGVSCAALDPPCEAPLPPHDECNAAIRVFTNEPYSGTTIGATGTDISSCTVLDTKDVWHRWIADCTGTAVINLCGSLYDTSLALYDACGGNELACNDNFCGFQSEISPRNPSTIFPVIGGETYYIRVSGERRDTGNYTLTVESCANACCFIDSGSGAHVCALGTLQQCSSVDGTLQGPGTVCLGDADRNGIDDVCEQVQDNWFWKDYNDDEPGGYMPDFDQNKDYDNLDGDGDPATGVDPNYCGPTAVADSLWWFHRKFPDAGVVPAEFTKLELIEELARLMGTNGTSGHPSPNGHQGPYVGTFIDDLESGIDAYLADNHLTTVFDGQTEPRPTYEFVVDQLMQGRDVTLLLGFYHVDGVDPIGDPPTGYLVQWRRTGGHYVTVAGVNQEDEQLAISDPDADAAEEAGGDFVRGDDHNHDGDGDPATTLPFRDENRDHVQHNDKGLASHDVYDALPTTAPAPDDSSIPGGNFVLAVSGDPLTYGETLAPFHEEDAGGSFDVDPTFLSTGFLQQNGYPLPVFCQTYTVLEAAVVVSPFVTRLDINKDGTIDYSDWSLLVDCWGGPDVSEPPDGCLPSEFQNADLQRDGDVDMRDAGIFMLHFAPENGE